MHWIDPAYLPETKGTVDRFLINAHGDAEGLMLRDGKEVHFPRHLAKRVLAAFKPGDPIKVRGVRPRGVDMIAAVSLQAGEAAAITDEGPPKDLDGQRTEKKPDHESEKHVEVEGVVRHLLHGPRGEKRGALLDDGTIVRMPPHAATRCNELLSLGHPLAARGERLTNALGTVINAHEFGASLGTLRSVDMKTGGKHEKSRHPKHEDRKPERAA